MTPKRHECHAGQPALARELTRLLSGLRWRIRAYVWFEGLALATIWLGLTFWLGLAADYLPVRLGASEMPRVARAGLLALMAAMLAYIVYRWVIQRAFIHLAGRSMAVLLERCFPRFHDSLLTAVELRQAGRDTHDVSQAMLAHTDRQALDHVGEVRFRRVFNFLPLTRNLVLALAFIGSVVLFAVMARESFAIWLNRMYLLSSQPWPRRTHIELLGFEGRTLKAARGSSVAIRVRADATRETPVPDVCTIYYRTREGERGRANMTKTGSTREGFQYYSFSGKPFQGILSSIGFDVVGDDHRLRDYRVQVVPSPSIIDVEVTGERPAYTGLLPVTLPWSPGLRMEMGSHITLRARANKDLRAVRLVDPRTQSVHRPTLSDGANRRQFEYEIDSLDRDAVWDISLEDTDSIVSQRPHRITIEVIEDQAPRVDVGLHGIGTAITVNARIPVAGSIVDDHGIGRAWFDLTAKDLPSRQFACRIGENGIVKDGLDLRAQRTANRDLPPMQEGSSISLVIKAADLCDLRDKPNVGQGDVYELDVVSPSDLLARLEARELGLRRNFERMISEMKQARDSLARAKTESGSGVEPEDRDMPTEALPNKQSAGDAPRPDAERATSLRLLRVQRAMQYSQRTRQEVAGVAASFDDICEELINNRVNSQEREKRIKTQISAPLKHIADQLFPMWGKQLGLVQSQINSPQVGPAVERAVAQADQILVAMEAVLAKMLEVEDYNELVDMVRSLIRDQKAIIERTKKERKKQLLGPLGSGF